ncbi:polymer-forming cytoskeletal protein [Burkholderiaceae bacterium DAT-1]|nr:polymer-forming cytoskeletal protein [Burkholderiaceae bacterium DAT-1]
MVFGNKKQKATTRIDSLIGLETRINGSITFAGGLRIDGEVCGDVIGEEGKATTLVVSEKARITGAIRVGHMMLNGTVEGPIHASHFLELQSKCKVKGDVHYSTLEMHPGAVVSGQLIHAGTPGSAPVASGTVSAKKSAKEAAPQIDKVES